ncbi:hypothetical protein Q9K01_02600 [Qipengyuania sp. DY56-A-20]|jgi:hypothetical protein|uniref:Uncharacterized protein n=1 Tax=Qipengyuania benthica TaxID=3067651 RepID=A0ABT9H5C5_9SPHN|nr:hypothetical protein [Qipengyuania sp. DY56-A-20]MDP4538512.1 hypothetical protein [Qipengyuania sp. DY56-A-20]
MKEAAEHRAHWNSKPWRVAAWSTAAALMLVPIAVQLTRGHFGWSIGDFVGVAMILLFGSAIFDLAARRAQNFSYIAGAAAALAATFGLFVVNGAVGLVGSEDEAHNLFFFTVLVVAFFGSILAGGRPEPMAKVMLAAAGTHIAVSTVLLIDANGVSDGDPEMELVGLGLFTILWLASAWLFRSASDRKSGLP